MTGLRTVVYECGAFELCLPSLGFFFTKLTLRSQLLGQACHMTKVWVGSGHKQSATLCRRDLSSSLSRSDSVGVMRPMTMPGPPLEF